MELIKDVFELGVKCFLAWLAALWVQSQTGYVGTLWVPFFVCLLAVFYGRELIRRRGSRSRRH